MVRILEFRQPENNRPESDIARTSVKYPNGRSAEIIIFPGVRIERTTEQSKSSAAPKTRKRAKRTARRKL